MKVVLDTNVLISAFVFKGFSATVYDYCIRNEEVSISDWIMNELQSKMKERFNFPEDQIDEVTALVKERVKIETPDNELPDICRDQDDNHVLQVGSFVNADYIITGDKDLLILKQYGNTRIITPRAFYDQFMKKN